MPPTKLPSRYVDQLGYTFIKKTADEPVANSTTLQDDDELQFVLPDGYTAEIDGAIYSVGSGSLKAGFNCNEGNLTLMNMAVQTGLATYTQITGTNTTVPQTSATNSRAARFYGNIVNTSGSPVTVKLEWAQNTANATAMKVLAGSWLRYKLFSAT